MRLKCVGDGVQRATEECVARPNLAPCRRSVHPADEKSPRDCEGFRGELRRSQMLLSRNAASCDLDSAPTLVASTLPFLNRSDERRVGKECVSQCRSRW